MDVIEGVDLWYLNHSPSEKDLLTGFCFKPDFDVVGAFIFKHRVDGDWLASAIKDYKDWLLKLLSII